MSGVRRLWLQVHGVLGLLLGLPLVLMGLTGSVLVYYNEIDRALNPSIRPLAVAHPPISLAQVQQSLWQAEPQRDGSWRVELPLSHDAALTARYYQPAQRQGRFFAPLMLTLDPASLEVTSTRFWGDYGVTWIYDLHYTLLLGAPGRMAVGWLGVFMACSLLTGLWLWWPSRRRGWQALRPRVRSGSVRACYDVHVIAGVYAGALLFVLAVTGTALAWPDTARTLLQVPAPSSPALTASAAGQGQWRLGIDEGVAWAQSLFPQAELRWVELPPKGGSVLSVRLYQPQEPGRRFPKTRVIVDLREGRVLAVHDPLRQGVGSRIMDWMHPLHNGEAFGFVGRLLICLSGVLPLLLALTGWLRWYQKRRARLWVQRRRLEG
ncbi:MAG: PepSY-associated TM helix domain-containing protein [Hylemonella sp.]